jgi:hypothetical protein
VSRVESREEEFHTTLEGQAVAAFARVGKLASWRAMTATPVGDGEHGGPGGGPGHARDAHAWVVLDEKGSIRAGTTQTKNGHQVPVADLAHHGGITLALVNLAGYWLWIEIGARGRPGRAILLSEFRAMGPEIKAALERPPSRRAS